MDLWRLDELFASLDLKEMRIALSRLAAISESEAEFRLFQSLEEAKISLRSLGHFDPHGKRILEIGAGFGFASHALALQGATVTALEPGGQGFSENAEMIAVIGLQLSSSVNLLRCPIDDGSLAASDVILNSFDLIFSNNVLEHVDDLPSAFANMKQMLGLSGLMVHTMPNYVVPFEPHFSIPLVPFHPEVTRALLPRRIVDSPLWTSLNFVTSYQIMKLAETNDLICEFDQGTFLLTVARLGEDPAFSTRHKILKTQVFRRILRSLATMSSRISPKLLTPMTIRLRHRT
jgi:2-polyprenyl-3-methyl-5-hydroxy-6-metoxy-1,4-benzoquinol methylase